MSSYVYAIATMDTKGDELQFVADCLRRAGIAVRTVDVSTGARGIGNASSVDADVCPAEVLGWRSLPSTGDRGEAIAVMSDGLREYLRDRCDQGLVAGVLGIGGSGGTALVTAAMRALPIGLPKLMVSTMASGNTAPYVDCSDVTMMYSVVDVAGLNAVSVKVLSNAAHAMAGMVGHRPPPHVTKPATGATMFGVTTPCVTMVRRLLEENGYDCLVFHATGSGGRAMERLVESGMIGGVLDVTTTEVADQVVGGVLSAGPDRFDRLLRSQVPLVISLGALDMVNFGGVETVPAKFRGRRLHVHNAHVTLMRTNEQENRQIARWLAEKFNRSTAPLVVLVPERGVSMLDAPGQPFYDPQADAALFAQLERSLEQTHQRRIRRLPLHINDPPFAEALVEQYLTLARRT